MCANCISNAEGIVAQAALAAYVLKRPLHQLLASAGLAPEPDPVAHDVRTVAFLRSLNLDPVEILGAPAVDAAAAWQPRPAFAFPRLTPSRLFTTRLFTTRLFSTRLFSTRLFSTREMVPIRVASR